MSTPLSPVKIIFSPCVCKTVGDIYKLVGLVNRRVGAFGKPLGCVAFGLVTQKPLLLV